jgi:hypothetical protein
MSLMTRPIVVLLLVAEAASCVDIDGGAVEASWIVGAEDGRAIRDCECADPAIKGVRFSLVGRAPDAVKGTRPCEGRAACEFSCQRHGGATPFDIPPGEYAISLTPLNGSGDDLTMTATTGKTVSRVTTIVRDVVEGQVTQLPAILLVVPTCAASCSGMNERKVCESP